MYHKVSSFKVNTKGDFLKIYTLGRFEIIKGDHVITAGKRKSYRLWELFGYLLTHRNRMIPSSALIDMLWSDQDIVDPEHALQNLIYRLRKTLTTNNLASSTHQYITLNQGFYRFHPSAQFWLDTDEMEALSKHAKEVGNKDSAKAITAYRQALALYQGMYLPEHTSLNWITPVRNYYQQLYVNCTLELAEHLGKLNQPESIRKLCETALVVEPYEEQFHHLYIQSLILTSKIKEAHKYQRYLESKIYPEIGIQPDETVNTLLEQALLSDKNKLKNLSTNLRLIRPSEQSYEPENHPIPLRQNSIHEDSSNGYWSASISVIGSTNVNDLENTKEALRVAIEANIRNNDLLTKWHDNQYIVVFFDSREEQAQQVINRIKFDFYSKEPASTRLEIKRVWNQIITSNNAIN